MHSEPTIWCQILAATKVDERIQGQKRPGHSIRMIEQRNSTMENSLDMPNEQKYIPYSGYNIPKYMDHIAKPKCNRNKA